MNYECEICGCQEEYREYTFGMNDATVVVWECRHATCYKCDSGTSTCHKNYNDAMGQARLIVAHEDAFAHKYGM